MTEIRDFAGELGRRLFADTRVELGDLWDKLSERDRDLVSRIARRASEMNLAKLAGNGINEREWDHLDAQLLQIASAGEGKVRKAFKSALRNAFKQVVSFLA